MFRFNFGRGSNIPPVVKNLIIINAVMFVGMILFSRVTGANLNQILGLYYIQSPKFIPFQIVTHMFMHDDNRIFHLFFNMWALWMFGRPLEGVWGGKRFLIYYLATGLGAALVHTLVNYIQLAPDMMALKAAYSVPSRVHSRDCQAEGSHLVASR